MDAFVVWTRAVVGTDCHTDSRAFETVGVHAGVVVWTERVEVAEG